MKDYLYDGTFEGLLTCIYHHYYTDRASGIYHKDEYQPNMLTGSMEVETETDKAERVYEAIDSKISSYALRCVYLIWLSSVRDKENIILKYVLLGFRKGHQLSSLHGDPVVHEVEAIVKKVNVEAERMLQFVRFEIMDVEDADPAGSGDADSRAVSRQIMYARIEPEHDVIELAAGHFAERFRHDPVIICDTGRNKAVVAYEGSWYITEFEGMQLPDGTTMVRSREEQDYQDLWRTYFDHIAIKQRINPKCQKNFMPGRYWKHLTEVNNIML